MLPSLSRTTRALTLAALTLALPGLAAAQQGQLVGTVTDAENGRALSGAQIQVLGGAQRSMLTDDAGRYRLQLPPGTYSLFVQLVGYRDQRFDGVGVSAGQTTTYDIRLTSDAFELDQVVVTASRNEEKETDAPATVFTVHANDIRDRPTTTPVDHLRLSPGVDIITYGIQGSNVVVRGFNNIFSGSLHMLTDHRLAGIPSLRVNLMHFIPANDDDIDRMEVVLGPGSALYGPNTANGVVHIITKSPLASQGTSVTVGGGERSIFQGSFRTAFLLGSDLGVKVSGQYLRGDEWHFDDPTEIANRLSANQNPQQCLADKMLRGLTQAEATAACGRIGNRDYSTERFGFEARADWRFAEDGTFIATYGRNNSSGVELTGLGTGQTVDWVYAFYQARVNFQRFFAQAYLNTSDAGESYLLNNGVPLVDRSRLVVGQLQHGFDAADGRLDFTYGFDYIGTRPRTEGNINGQYEDDDSMDEWGVYLQGRASLTERVDLVGAGRIDHHSILDHNVFSPRAALVLRPDDENTFRLSYNQAYSSPSSLNYFLDISNGFAPGLAALGYGLRAFGTGRDGWSLQNDDGSLMGFRSPFNPGGAGQTLPMGATTGFWPAAIGVLMAQVQGGGVPLPGGVTQQQVLQLLQGLAALSPQPGSIGTMLYHPVDETLIPLSQANLPGVPSIKESNTETYEVGWTAILNDRVKISADVYRSTQNDFVSPLLVQTPLVLFNGQDVGAFITVPVVTAITQMLVGAGLPLDVAQQQAQQLAQSVIPALAAGIAQVPIGVVSSPLFSGGSDLIVSYRNVGDLTLWGADLALQWLLDDRWTLGGSYSWVSDDTFTIEDGSPISLNAPTHKGSVSLGYRDARAGFNAEGRFRFNNGFPAVSAGFEGDVPDTKVFDAAVGYQIPGSRATVQLSVNNVFNAHNQSFVGVPSIGRLAMIRMRYEMN